MRLHFLVFFSERRPPVFLFCVLLFRQELSGNTLNLHYTLKDPSAFDMEDLPVSLGTYNSDAQGLCVSLENMLCQMDGFDRSRLSSDNRLTYDILYDSLSASLKTAPFLLYEEPLSPLTGMQSQLPILLSEYPFYDRQDVKDYLTLLTQVPDYFTSILAFEKEKGGRRGFCCLLSASILWQKNAARSGTPATTAISTTPLKAGWKICISLKGNNVPF